MNSKIAILIGIIIYLILQNFIIVYNFHLSFIWKIKRLPQPESKQIIIDDEISRKSQKKVGPLSENQADPTSSLNKEAKKTKKEVNSKEKNDLSPSFYYRHMNNYSEMFDLREKLVTKFGQNLNASFPHSFIIRNENLCSESPYIVNLLLSTPTDFQARLDIRNMWGSSIWWKATKFKVVHLLGKSQDNATNEAVLAENDQYGDIVQFDFIDSYDNLTVKVLSGLHWTNLHCPNVEWVMKSDIDVLINIFKLTSLLKLYDKNKKDAQPCILCRVKLMYMLQPVREGTKLNKWKVDYDEYPFDTYPPYCTGAAYLIPRSLIPKLYAAADKLSPFQIEDVYYTGILRQLLKEHVELININTMVQWNKWSKKQSETSFMIFEIGKNHATNFTAKGEWKKIISRLKYKPETR